VNHPVLRFSKRRGRTALGGRGWAGVELLFSRQGTEGHNSKQMKTQRGKKKKGRRGGKWKKGALESSYFTRLKVQSAKEAQSPTKFLFGSGGGEEVRKGGPDGNHRGKGESTALYFAF